MLRAGRGGGGGADRSVLLLMGLAGVLAGPCAADFVWGLRFGEFGFGDGSVIRSLDAETLADRPERSGAYVNCRA